MQDFSTHIVRLLFIAIVLGFVALVTYGLTALAVQFLFALILAFLLTPAVNGLEGFGIPRILAVFFILSMTGLAIYWTIRLSTPFLMAEFRVMMEQSDIYVARLKEALDLIRTRVQETFPGFEGAAKLEIGYVLNLLKEPVASTLEKLPSYLPVLFTSSIITPIILVIFLLQGPELFRSILSMVPNRYFEMTLQLAYRIRRQISSYLLGMMLQWLIIFVILLTGYGIIGLPYAPIAALIGASLNALPYIGPLAGLLPALFLAAASSDLLVPTLLAFAAAQLVDNVFNQPVLLARSVDIHPLIAILAFITFSDLLGIMGMVIAIPLAAMIMVTIQIMYRSLKAFKII
ncbi:MAG: AI-2E family transporter [Spirochaetales bacterium]|nr:AI-2E family transporter [Spirochaetales bacterium]